MSENSEQPTGGTARITISDIAEALDISKTTVSRAISGKGRIGEKTRERVLAYIEKYNYHPNPMAKGLAQLKTYNIGWVMPGDVQVASLPFFQRCMLGVSQVAADNDYDILLAMVYEKDMSQLERIVQNHKVDGIVLGRTLVEDERVEFLRRRDIPFVVIGSSTAPGVIQIDNDHISACRELTSILLMKGLKKLALIGGDSRHMVNRTRRQGFLMGLENCGIDKEAVSIFMDCRDRDEIAGAVERCVQDGTDCIVCMDDEICSEALEKLKENKISVPKQMRVASFYDSVLLHNHVPTVTSLQYDPRNLGVVAAKTLIDLINGKPVETVTYLGYEVALRGSTQ